MTPDQLKDIQTALDAIKANLPARQRFINYYDGRHELAFATDKFKTAFGRTLKDMRDNLCPIVVDAVADRMEVINFAGDNANEDAAIAKDAWTIWQREQMELISNETHVEAIKAGCAYLIVWADENNEAQFYLQDSRNCVIIDDEETEVNLFGAKQWDTKDEFIRLTLYYPDRIEKYISTKKRGTYAGDEIKAASFQPVDIKGENDAVIEAPVEKNPYGVIPMFEFETNPVLGDAIPLQDVLNKTLADRMVSQEFAAFRQRWATGLEPETNELTGVPTLPFKAGADRLWFTNSNDVKFGEFDATELAPFLAAADSDRLEMARVTGTPLHFFSIQTGNAVSGEALKTLESRFTKKVQRLTLNFGAVWAQVMHLALQIEGGASSGNLTTQWEAPEQRSENELLASLVIKQSLGVPDETLWEEMGYSIEDIAKFNQAKTDAVLAAQKAMTVATPTNGQPTNMPPKGMPVAK